MANAVDERTAKALNETYRQQVGGIAPGRRPPPGTPPARPGFSVVGAVSREDKTPVEGVNVEVFDKGLRALKSLDVKKSDEKGKFDLSFERSDLLDPDRERTQPGG